MAPDGLLSSGWALAARFTSIGEAVAARSALDAAGIENYVADENMISIDWLYSQAIRGFKMMVHDDDVERAREVIESLASAETGEVEPYPVERPRAAATCEECGSTELVRIPRFRIFLLVAMVFIGIGAAVGQPLLAATGLIAIAVGAVLMPTHQCRSCGARSAPEEDDVEPVPPLPERHDLIDRPCPRCGSLEVHRIPYRELRVLPMLVAWLIFVVVPIWWALPKWRCDSCGLKLRRM